MTASTKGLHTVNFPHHIGRVDAKRDAVLVTFGGEASSSRMVLTRRLPILSCPCRLTCAATFSPTTQRVCSV